MKLMLERDSVFKELQGGRGGRRLPPPPLLYKDTRSDKRGECGGEGPGWGASPRGDVRDQTSRKANP